MWRLNSILLLLACLPCLGQPLSPHDPAMMTSSSSLRKGLVGYWRMEEPSSSSAYDCSPNGLVLTNFNNPASIAGQVNLGRLFLQSQPNCVAATSSNLVQFRIGQPWTFAAWVKSTNISAYGEIVGKMNGFGQVRGWEMMVSDTGKLFVSIRSSSTIVRYRQGSTTLFNAFHHVVGTYDGSGTTNGISLFVDGAAETVGSDSSSGVMTDIDNEACLTIGARGSITGHGVSSGIRAIEDEVGIWNRVLTANEIAFLYAQGLGSHFPWAHP